MQIKPYKMGIIVNDYNELKKDQIVYIIDQNENFYIVKVENTSRTINLLKNKLKFI